MSRVYLTNLIIIFNIYQVVWRAKNVTFYTKFVANEYVYRMNIISGETSNDFPIGIDSIASSQDAKVTSAAIQSGTNVRYSQAKSTNSRHNEKQESPLSGRQLKRAVTSTKNVRMEKGGGTFGCLREERTLEMLLAGMFSR